MIIWKIILYWLILTIGLYSRKEICNNIIFSRFINNSDVKFLEQQEPSTDYSQSNGFIHQIPDSRVASVHKGRIACNVVAKFVNGIDYGKKLLFCNSVVKFCRS